MAYITSEEVKEIRKLISDKLSKYGLEVFRSGMFFFDQWIKCLFKDMLKGSQEVKTSITMGN